MTQAIISGSNVAYLLPDGATVDLTTGVVSIGGDPAWTAGDIQNGSLPDPQLKSGIALFDADAPVGALMWNGTAIVAGPGYGAALVNAKTAVSTAVSAQFNNVLAAGYPTGGYHIAIDDGSRANLAGMGATALGVLSGVPGVVWPASYQNWFSIEGVALPIPTAADGLALANGAGGYYSLSVVNEATLLGETAACASFTELSAIDPTTGWPT